VIGLVAEALKLFTPARMPEFIQHSGYRFTVHFETAAVVQSFLASPPVVVS
jgi:hypothetical protein